jgi:N4-gp56 family major capsid protein
MGKELVSYKKEIKSKQITLPKYEHLTLVTSALTDKTDATSEALSDSSITITPAEYGNVVTKTLLASMQTGGIVDSAAARVVAMNAARSENRLALIALDSSTNILRVNDRAADTDIVAGDVMSTTELGQLYNKLKRASVPPLAGGKYVLVCHDDVAHDLREETSAGSWQDISKYTDKDVVLANEIGTLKGFKIVVDNLATLTADGGSGTVDVYTSYALGFNALGHAVSFPTQLRVAPAGDKLGRFVNVGWLGIFGFKIVDQDALWVMNSSSSVGSN